MTNDGRWSFTWDAENRLVKVESRSDTPQASWRRVEWAYDAFGRRIRQRKSVWTNNAWQVIEDLKFVSDPMLFGRHIAELNASDDTLVRTYVWGLDLSGSLEGAGGVGGLLWVNQHTGSSAGAHFCAYDGNGNIVALSAASDGSETARYEYGPFGEPIRVTGPMAKENPFRFSTKHTDNISDIVLYEYRAYSHMLGRWFTRDPSEEHGGISLYAFVLNNPVGGWDILGLYNWGSVGPFLVTVEPPYTRYSIDGNWFFVRPGHGSPCCEKPARASLKRTDKFYLLLHPITMRVDLSFTGGPHKELVLLWYTCFRPDYTVGYMTNCNNSLSCKLPTRPGEQFTGMYVTSAQISYLSCENGTWTTIVAYAMRDYYGSFPKGWTYK